jgi:hypothetical protein
MSAPIKDTHFPSYQEHVLHLRTRVLMRKLTVHAGDDAPRVDSEFSYPQVKIILIANYQLAGQATPRAWYP